ncbi:MAG: tRNA pseudouridine(38-40) synthase TruA [Bacteroidia bacterium]|nr:tRNA pseudouridine(38-40) synthase TruA [Bacteroidia bacterium]
MPVRNRFFIFLSYRGTNFHGWQIQPNALTIQQTLDSALSLAFGEQIATTGAGRTDAGVHAMVFCAHFDSDKPGIDTDKKLLFRLNRLLPADIAIKNIRKVVPDANARYSAVSRTYKYFISRKKDPFFESSSWFIYGHLDIEAMNIACKILLKYDDFTSFSKLHSDAKTNICRIYSAEWNETDERLIFTIKADRFLRNMVRAIVGTMVEIGSGKTDLEGFEGIILGKNRCLAGKSAPAKGLFLTDIEYPVELFI